MNKAIVSSLALAAIGGAAYAYVNLRQTAPTFTVTTSAVARGDIVETVRVTRTLQAVTIVQIGTRASGTLQRWL